MASEAEGSDLSPAAAAGDAKAEDAEDADIRVTVLTLAGGEVVKCSLCGASTICDLKQLISKSGGPIPRLQVLAHGSCILSDTSTCNMLGWTAAEPVLVTMTRAAVNVEKCLAGLLHSKCRTRPGQLEYSELYKLCYHCKDIFLSESMLLELEPPFVVVGGMHGSFVQLLQLFERCGDLPETRYLFLGGYVDLGQRSLDTISLLFLHKIQHPRNMVLLRSKHEDAALSRIYGFFDECHRRYTIKLWKAFNDAFSCMPVCALIRGRIFCVSGGLSPDLLHLDNISQLARPCSVPEAGLLCDLMWAEPHSGTGWERSKHDTSFAFGEDVVRAFVEKTGLELIVRSCSPHALQEGYEFFADQKLVTLWSIYSWDRDDEEVQATDNRAAVLKVSEDLDIQFEVFDKFSSAGL